MPRGLKLPQLLPLDQPPLGHTPFWALAAATPGLVLYLPMGEASGTTANDAIARDDGTYQPSVTVAQTGLSSIEPTRTSILLNGTTGYTTVNAPYVPNTGDVFTWMLGIKRTSTGGLAQRLWDRNASNDFQIFISSANGGTLDHWDIEWQGGGVAMCVSTSTLDTNPHLLIATKNGAAIHLYQDGVDVSGAITNQTVTGATGSIIIGAHRNGGSDFAAVTMQDQALWNRDLSAAEVTALWNAWGTTSANVNAPAEASTGTGAGEPASVIVAPNSGNAAATGVAEQPAGFLISANAGNAAGTGLGEQPSIALSIPAQVSTGAGVGEPPTANVRPSPAATTGTGVAEQPQGFIVSITGTTTATGAGLGEQPTASVAPNAGAGTATGLASNAAAIVAPTAGNAAGTGAGKQPTPAVFVNGGLASGTGTALDPTVSTSSNVSANAQAATATGAAEDATAAPAVPAQAATGSGSALNALVTIAVNPAVATGTGVAFDATVTTTGGNISAHPDVALGTGLAFDVAFTAPGGGAVSTAGVRQFFRRRAAPIAPAPIPEPERELEFALAFAGVAAGIGGVSSPTTVWDDDESVLFDLGGL